MLTRGSFCVFGYAPDTAIELRSYFARVWVSCFSNRDPVTRLKVGDAARVRTLYTATLILFFRIHRRRLAQVIRDQVSFDVDHGPSLSVCGEGWPIQVAKEI